jgi:hypothetical protein
MDYGIVEQIIKFRDCEIIVLSTNKHMAMIKMPNGDMLCLKHRTTDKMVEFDTQGEAIYTAIERLLEYRGEIIRLSQGDVLHGTPKRTPSRGRRNKTNARDS